jgi:hypothetical protein
MPAAVEPRRGKLLQTWGPALVAAIVGAIPGSLALLQQRPSDTRVELRDAQLVDEPRQGVTHPSLEFRVINHSEHDVVVEGGTCKVAEGSKARFGDVVVRKRGGARVPGSEGTVLSCRLPHASWISQTLRPVDALVYVFTSDGQTWQWRGTADPVAGGGELPGGSSFGP